MSFIEVVDQVVELLRTRGRISYRALKREFDLDDETLEDLKETASQTADSPLKSTRQSIAARLQRYWRNNSQASSRPSRIWPRITTPRRV